MLSFWLVSLSLLLTAHADRQTRKDYKQMLDRLKKIHADNDAHVQRNTIDTVHQSQYIAHEQATIITNQKMKEYAKTKGIIREDDFIKQINKYRGGRFKSPEEAYKAFKPHFKERIREKK